MAPARRSTHDRHPERQDTVKTRIFGIPINVTGINAIMMLMMGGALAFSGYLLLDITRSSTRHLDEVSAEHAKAREEQTEVMAKDHQAIVEAVHAVQSVNEKIQETMNEQNYIVLSNEKERADMKKRLGPPASLSRKLESGRY